MSDLPAGDPPLTAEERSAVRAYLQRSEVRLSTMLSTLAVTEWKSLPLLDTDSSMAWVTA